MRKLILGMALTLTIGVSAAAAAPPANPLLRNAEIGGDLIEVRGGHGHGWGHGHGHGWGNGHGYQPYGWNRGRKVGWRGHGCPPGQWKKGRC